MFHVFVVSLFFRSSSSLMAFSDIAFFLSAVMISPVFFPIHTIHTLHSFVPK